MIMRAVAQTTMEAERELLFDLWVRWCWVGVGRGGWGVTSVEILEHVYL